MTRSPDREKKIQTVKELTSFLFHKHYCENDVEAIIKLFDDELSWIGAGENEYDVGTETVSGIFRQFVSMVPKCNIWGEEYDVIDISPDVSICSGRAWIATDPSTNVFLRVHQRITAVFRWVDDRPRCCHIHISNPYSEMTQEDVGFPTQIGQYTYEYLNTCIDEYKRKIEEQTRLLEKLSFEDSLTGLFNRNKFNLDIENFEKAPLPTLGVAAIDLNGLKPVNDHMGHSAGDALICRTANHISAMLEGRCYRIGGDEFAVIDPKSEEDAFQKAIAAAKKNMEQDGISVSVGISWRSGNCSIREQLDEADRQMYQEKAVFYGSHDTDRRNGGC